MVTMRGHLRSDLGGGLMSPKARRELRELNDGAHPRQMLSPDVELEVSDESVRLAAEDEDRTMFDPDTHPKAFLGLTDPSEPIADGDGNAFDIMADTDPVMVEVGETDRDPILEGLPELDDLASLDVL